MAVIAIDLDGCLYSYHSAFVYMARNCLGVDMPDASEWDHWNWPFQYLSDYEQEWMEDEAVKLGLYRYGHIMKGGILAVRKIAETHDVIVVTHRPREAVRDTLAWLTYADLPLSGLHILSDGQPKSSVKWDLLIDDKFNNITDAVCHARKAVLFDQAWNREDHALYRATWERMEGTIERALRPE